MLWIIYALTSAFFTAVATILLKLSLKTADPFFTAALQMVTATLFLLVIYVSMRGLPTFKTGTPGLNLILLSGLAAGLLLALLYPRPKRGNSNTGFRAAAH